MQGGIRCGTNALVGFRVFPRPTGGGRVLVFAVRSSRSTRGAIRPPFVRSVPRLSLLAARPPARRAATTRILPAAVRRRPAFTGTTDRRPTLRPGTVVRPGSKDVESIAYLHDRERQGLQKFIGQAEWNHQPLLTELARQV